MMEGVAVAAHWKGPYRRKTPLSPLDLPGNCEDASIRYDTHPKNIFVCDDAWDWDGCIGGIGGRSMTDIPTVIIKYNNNNIKYAVCTAMQTVCVRNNDDDTHIKLKHLSLYYNYLYIPLSCTRCTPFVAFPSRFHR